MSNGQDPAFLFYPGDWLGGTMGMTFEQKGAYIDLLVFQFNNNHFTEPQAKQVLSICFASVWEVVSTKFKKEGNNNEFLYNERLRFEIEKRKAFSESRRINALHPKKPRKKVKAYAKHMGNENINENKDIIKDKKGVLTLMPDNFLISDRVKKWAEKKGYGKLEEHLEAFKLKCQSKDYKYVNWDSGFMNAINDDWAKLRSGGTDGTNINNRGNQKTFTTERDRNNAAALDEVDKIFNH